MAKKLTKAEAVGAMEAFIRKWEILNTMMKAQIKSVTAYEMGVMTGMEVTVKELKEIVSKAK